MERLWFQNEGKVTYTMSTKEQPVLSYNDLAFIQPQNSIVFRAGDPIVWNRNQTILPMSWQLFGGNNEKSVHQFGREYNLQTIPTLSNAIDFDVRRNTPDFINMLNKRIAQAVVSKTVSG